MARILISYRRESGWALAGRLYDVLVERFGRENVFIDIDDIEAGADFVAVLEDVLASTDALIPIIDRDWSDAIDRDGNRRLDAPDDFVRLEIATALRRDILVVPLLEPGARFPEPEHLPDDLRALTRRNAIEVSQKHFRVDVDRLAEMLESLRTEADLSHLGRHARAAARILADPDHLARWERNFWIRDAIWAPAIGGAMGWHTMRGPLLERMERLDLSEDPEMEAKRDELAALIRAQPDADHRRVDDDGSEIHYDLKQTPEITLLLEDLDHAISQLVKIAREASLTARKRAFRDSEPGEEEIETWYRNGRIQSAVFVPELGDPDVGPNNTYTRREALLEYLDHLSLSSDPELDARRKRLVELVTAARRANKHSSDHHYNLLLTTEMQLLRAEIDVTVHCRGEAAAELR
ncbi:MAG TPA: TIR domain-containing protein [Longimicrobiales bacterium]|nr:TIR domain-containing protein [Longimicrobiales bacterium]